MDEIFEQEQVHLKQVYEKLNEIAEEQERAIEKARREAAKDINAMRGELALDFADADKVIETWGEFQQINSVIDAYNFANDASTERLNRVTALLRQPYFAKVTLQFKPDAPAQDVYLGTAGMTDDGHRHFVVDWRSPVAETYYSQENGPMTYRAAGRDIHVDLKLRRQFDIERDELKAYFDTTVAIEDPMLLKSLSKHRSEKMSDITATIQKEQNQVVRHEDVDALLVNGIAGSGKTSVLLQRIAYLFYRQRGSLKPQDVYLITPNPVFGSYIDNVLPDLGESNPHILTWREFLNDQGLLSRGLGADTTAEALNRIDDVVAQVSLDSNDLKEIKVGKMRLIKLGQLANIMRKYSGQPVNSRTMALACEQLHERLDSRLAQLAQSDDIRIEIESLDLDAQVREFGRNIAYADDDEMLEFARQYVQKHYACAHDDIEQFKWIRFDRVGQRLLGKENLSSVEWLYLKLAMTGAGCRSARYVMIDEVQDYTESQLMLLARYFNNAKFLLLGDQYQAIKPGTATFPQIRELFSNVRETLDECRLMTSYRSTSEVTSLFAHLVDAEDDIKAASVHRNGDEPVIRCCDDEPSYEQALRDAVDAERNEEGLTAVIALEASEAKRVGKLLDDVQVMEDDARLPAQGVVVMELALAKGLEFDRVVVVGADGANYPDDDLARRRLYTAVSRATHRVTVLACGELTPLLHQ